MWNMTLLRITLVSAILSGATSIGLRIMLRVASVDTVADTLASIVGLTFVLWSFRGSSGKLTFWKAAGIAVGVNLVMFAIVRTL
jgi:hypothetical protein